MLPAPQRRESPLWPGPVLFLGAPPAVRSRACWPQESPVADPSSRAEPAQRPGPVPGLRSPGQQTGAAPSPSQLPRSSDCLRHLARLGCPTPQCRTFWKLLQLLANALRCWTPSHPSGLFQTYSVATSPSTRWPFPALENRHGQTGQGQGPQAWNPGTPATR